MTGLVPEVTSTRTGRISYTTREYEHQSSDEDERRRRKKRRRREREQRKQREREEERERELEESNLLSLPQRALQAMKDIGALGSGDTSDDNNGGLGEGAGRLLDYQGLRMKVDADSRPVWVSGDGRIFLETFSPIYKQAYDFLVAIAEPVSRPEFVHEYRLTPYALYAAVSVGLDAASIIRVLKLLSKTELPPEIPKLIRACTKTYGKAKLVLHKGKYLVQTSEEEVLKLLMADKVIAYTRVEEKDGEGATMNGAETNGLADSHDLVLAGSDDIVSDSHTIKALTRALDVDTDSDEDDNRNGARKTFSFEIRGEEVEHVKRRAIELDYPLMEEYDFKNDTVNPSISIDLKPIAKIRPYQEKSLEKMFGNGRARSGVIVLPCGAGKSLVGVTAACTIKKPVLCICTSSVSVEQWRHEFDTWASIERDRVGRFTASSNASNAKSFIGDVTVSTYSMISHSGKRTAESQRMLEELKSREWGLLLLDEVHVVPANVFRKVVGVIKAHCKLGLTATLVREDEKIGDINFLIGPKLYEANWIDLQKEGYLATVQCAEVWCPMTKDFYREYLSQTAAKKKLLYAMNPNKFRKCQYLVRYHESRGDKVIIFSDNIYALKLYALRLQRPFIYGPTSQQERLRILNNFQHNPQLGTILLSKVGDTSINLPEANVLIQVSSHYGSRRQEAQRLGRILRPKRRAGQNFNAFFYSLVSTDTQEMYYSSKRQQFLIDQGYSFKVITTLDGMERAKLDFDTVEEQRELLVKVLAADEGEATEHLDADVDERELFAGTVFDKGLVVGRRTGRSVAALSGGSGLRYTEFTRKGDSLDVNHLLHRPVVRHALFKKRARGDFSRKQPALEL